MAILSEAGRAGGYVLPGHNTDINNSKARFSGTGVPGQVLGLITATSIYAPLNVGASDGTQTARAILWDHQAAVTNKEVTVTNRGPCDVNGFDLVWPAGITGPQTTTAVGQLLTNSDIRVRYNT
jgi:hypothetical protein